MTKITNYDLVCTCGHKFKVELYDSLNVTLDPRLLQEVFNNEFNIVECPKCKKQTPIDKYLLFHNRKKNFMMEFGNIKDFKFWLQTNGYFGMLNN